MKLVSSLATITLLAALFALTALKHLFVPFNHDNAVHIHAAETILEKGSLYAHMFETNPPLFPWLTTLPVMLAEAQDGSAFFYYRLMIYIVAALVLLVIAREFKWFGGYTGRFGVAAILSFWAALLIGLQVYDFGQRDHLIGILVFPYVVNLAARLHNPEARKMPIHVGVLLALGIAIKPYFIGIWVLGEIAVVLRGGAKHVIANAGNLTLAAMGATYLAAVQYFEPAFFSEIVPMIRATYGAFGYPLQPGDIFVWASFTVMQIIALWVHAGRADKETRSIRLSLSGAFFIASQGAFIGFAVQSHFPYQLWPFIMLSCAPVVLLFIPAGSGARDLADQLIHRIDARRTRHLGPSLAMAVSLVMVGVATPSWVWPETIRTARHETSAPIVRARHFPGLQKQVDIIDRYAPGGSFYTFSTNVSAVFPAVHYSSAEWKHRYHTLWPLPAVAWVEALSAATGSRDPLPIATRVLDQVTEDFERHPPTLVLVDVSPEKSFFPPDRDRKRSFDYLGFFNRSDTFRQVFSGYVPCGSFRTSANRVFAIYLEKRSAGDKLGSCPVAALLASGE